MRFGHGDRPLGGEARPDRGAEGGVVVSGGRPVVCQPCPAIGPVRTARRPGVARNIGDEGLRVAPVETRQLPRQDLVEHGLVHEGVAEAVPTELVVDDEELVVDTGA
jgi:hypothetical protein